MRNFAITIAIILVSALIALASYEGFLRVKIAKKLDQHFAAMPLWLQNQTIGISEVDRITGRDVRTVPNGLFKVDTDFDFGAEVGGREVLDFSVRTNNLGLMSDLPVEIERNAEAPEYRVLVFGDSLTGTVTANYQWVDTVQQLLNDNASVREAVGSRKVRVYNLGWVAAGFGHFWEAYERAGAQLKADLIVVNFTYDDFPRRHQGPRFSDPDEMVAQASEAVNNFRKTGIPVIVTQMPLYAEIVPEQIDFPMTHRMEEKTGLKVVDMRPRLPITPTAPLRLWYNLPYDHHMSDYGGELYARAVAGVIAEKVGARDRDFMAATSAYFDPARCLPNASNEPAGPETVMGFGDLPAAPQEVGEASIALPEDWRALATGGGGKGAARISRSVDPADGLMFQQHQPSQSGSPSLTKVLGDATVFAGQTISFKFRVRAQGVSDFSAMFVRHYGAGVKGVPAEVLIDQASFKVSDAWRDIEVKVSVPPMPEGVSLKGPGHFRMQLLPTDSKATFTLELAPVAIRSLGKSTQTALPEGCASRPRSETAVRRILDNPAAVARLRQAVRDRLGWAKVYSLRPWLFDTVQGLDPLIPPLTKAMKGGFIEVAYGDKPGESTFLNIFCTSGALSLDNPSCYTNQHFFVR